MALSQTYELTALQTEKRSEEALAEDHDANLIERLKQRDSSAFQELIDMHGDSIRNLVGRLMAYDSEMEDVVQNTFVQVWRKVHLFRKESSLKTWIVRIAIMQSRNHQRSVRRWMRRVQERWANDSASSIESRPQPHRDDPRWEIVQSAMQQLPYRDREILVLVYLQENSVQELAQSMNEKTNTLEVRLHRAKNRLRQLIEKEKSKL